MRVTMARARDSYHQLATSVYRKHSRFPCSVEWTNSYHINLWRDGQQRCTVSIGAGKMTPRAR